LGWNVYFITRRFVVVTCARQPVFGREAIEADLQAPDHRLEEEVVIDLQAGQAPAADESRGRITTHTPLLHAVSSGAVPRVPPRRRLMPLQDDCEDMVRQARACLGISPAQEELSRGVSYRRRASFEKIDLTAM
jgi:hypothetical protein